MVRGTGVCTTAWDKNDPSEGLDSHRFLCHYGHGSSRSWISKLSLPNKAQINSYTDSSVRAQFKQPHATKESQRGRLFHSIRQPSAPAHT